MDVIDEIEVNGGLIKKLNESSLWEKTRWTNQA